MALPGARSARLKNVEAGVDAPILALLGQQTRLDTWFTDSAQHLADARVRELPGVGHCALLVAPKPVANELISFPEAVGATRLTSPPGDHARGED